MTKQETLDTVTSLINECPLYNKQQQHTIKEIEDTIAYTSILTPLHLSIAGEEIADRLITTLQGYSVLALLFILKEKLESELSKSGE